MKMSSLQATQRILLINWVIVPALGIWIWVKSGLFSAVLFVIIWLIADKVWDWLTGLLIAGAGRIKASEHEAFQMEISGEVPGRMAFMMIVDLLGTFILPWVVAGFFLGGFGTANSLSSTSVKKWWITEYPALIQAVETSNDRTLSTTYRTGPGGEAEVKLTLIRKSNDGLVLKLNLPRQAIFSVDSKTGEKIPSSILPVITIRDHNQDGIPDDFNMEPSGEPLYEETVTKDGFIKFRSGTDHQSIWVQWSIAIGYSVNHFLHGFDSALPRK
ncbi:MAG: hypothetical protein AB1744_06645 [Candidatus Zixiibacteriota bacterium]